MRTEITYYAYDDTAFDELEDCIEYESHVLESLDSIVFFDEYNHVIEKSDSIEKCLDSYSNSFFMYIQDDELCHVLLKALSDYTGYIIPQCEFKADDVLAYDCVHDSWFNLTERVQNDTNTLQLLLSSRK